MNISAKYELTTPLMLGGANRMPEFRLSSYVHMVCWWWRFLALTRFGDSKTASYWEAVLFGWHTKNFGRKRVSFRLIHLNDDGYPAPWNCDPKLMEWSGINYLTAQGFKERKPVKVKDFRVEARLSKRPLDTSPPEFAGCVDENWRLAQETLIDAMALIGLLGGLGARSRRGFGSLAISWLKAGDEEIIAELPGSIDAYEKMINKRLGDARYKNHAPYSALSDKFNCEICASHGDARELMNDIGWAFQIYRSWGQKPSEKQKQNLSSIGALEYVHIKNWNSRNGTGEVTPAGKDKSGWYKPKFRDDHEKFYSSPLISGNFDNRAVFGLPHDYGKKINVGWDLPNENKYGRRASPLLFHFHRLLYGKCVFVASVIEAKFAPETAQLHVKRRNREARKDFSGNIDFSLTKDFAVFLRNPDATGRKLGVQHTSYTPENVTVAP